MGKFINKKDKMGVGFFKKQKRENIVLEQSENKKEETRYEPVKEVTENNLVNKVLKETLSSISETVNQIDLASEEMAKCIVTQANEVQDVNTKLTNIGNTVDATFQNVDVLATGYERITQCGTHGNNMLAELIDISKDNQKSIEDVRKQTDATNISAREISKAMSSIKGIAYQTNLLSLNASIEAARSGVSGRGFAVVANEIRKLADQSQNIAVQINQIVNMLIENSNLSVEIMTTVTESIKLQDEKLNNTNQVFEELVSEMNGVADAIEDVTMAMVDLEGLKDEAVESVTSLTKLSEENAANSEEISASMQEINQKIAKCIHTIE